MRLLRWLRALLPTCIVRDQSKDFQDAYRDALLWRIAQHEKFRKDFSAEWSRAMGRPPRR